jgi:hypothetical protein
MLVTNNSHKRPPLPASMCHHGPQNSRYETVRRFARRSGGSRHVSFPPRSRGTVLCSAPISRNSSLVVASSPWIKFDKRVVARHSGGTTLILSRSRFFCSSLDFGGFGGRNLCHASTIPFISGLIQPHSMVAPIISGHCSSD